MKRILSSLAAATVLAIGTGAALADGLPDSMSRGGSIKDAPMAAPAGCAQFGGFYIGGNLSSTYYKADRTDQDGFLSNYSYSAATYSSSDDSFGGGIQAGYNYQKGCTVMGLEIDYTWTGAEATSNLYPNGKQIGYNSPTSAVSSLNNFGTIRTRDGIVVDNVLLYVTGGLVWAETDTTYKGFAGSGGGTAATASFSDTRWGWTAGFGTEWMINKNLSINSQVLYLALENKTHDYNDLASGFHYSFNHDDSAWVTRIGVNWRFN